MNETEKNTMRHCPHNYELTDTSVSEDATEYIKMFICTNCGDECERRYHRAGTRKESVMIV